MLRDLVSNEKQGEGMGGVLRIIPKNRCAITEQLPPTHQQQQPSSVTNTVPVSRDGVVPGQENHVENNTHQPEGRGS